MTNEMTLRDYIAIEAMRVFIEKAANGTTFGDETGSSNKEYAEVAYSMADSMMEARGK